MRLLDAETRKNRWHTTENVTLVSAPTRYAFPRAVTLLDLPGRSGCRSRRLGSIIRRSLSGDRVARVTGTLASRARSGHHRVREAGKGRDGKAATDEPMVADGGMARSCAGSAASINRPDTPPTKVRHGGARVEHRPHGVAPHGPPRRPQPSLARPRCQPWMPISARVYIKPAASRGSTGSPATAAEFLEGSRPSSDGSPILSDPARSAGNMPENIRLTRCFASG